jgi:hypothetical protein
LLGAPQAGVAKVELGLFGGFEGSEFYRAALANAGMSIGVEFRRGDEPAKLVNFLELTSRAGRFMGTAADGVFEGLILPFEDTQPHEHIRKRLKDVIVKSYGDPRLAGTGRSWPYLQNDPGQDKRWRGMAVIKRWLVADSIDLFFLIIDRHAIDRQWRRRRALWKGYFDQGDIENAWLILGVQPTETARRIKIEEENSELEWGTLRGAGSDQSVLLMTVGDVTVLDWSHSGAFRAWRSDNANIPSFYRGSYDAGEDLRTEPDFRKVHGGDWEPDVINFIRNETGITPPVDLIDG